MIVFRALKGPPIWPLLLAPEGDRSEDHGAPESAVRHGDILLSACHSAGNFETFRRFHKVKRLVTQKCSPSHSSYVEYGILVRSREIF